jgi:hypothetical protein
MKTYCLALMITMAPLCGQEEILTLEWSSLSGGGQAAAAGAGEFTVEGTIGQISAESFGGETPGEFGVSGGYWSFTLNEPLDLGLALQLNGNSATLTWDDSTGIPVQLESSLDLQLWQPAYPQPLQPPFLDATGARRQFYRLMPVP